MPLGFERAPDMDPLEGILLEMPLGFERAPDISARVEKEGVYVM